MNSELINGLGNCFAENRSKNDVINDLIIELGRDGLDNSSIKTLIVRLRQKYPWNELLNKLNDTLEIEPEQEQKRNEKFVVYTDHWGENVITIL